MHASMCAYADHIPTYADHIPAYADVISALQTCAQNFGLRILAPYNFVPSYATHGAPYGHSFRNNRNHSKESIMRE